MTSPSRSLLDFFARSLTSFTSSSEPFRILCSLPHQHATNPQPRPSQPHQPRRLIILDSSFNPPTTAHAQMIHSAIDPTKTEADRVLLLLSVQNADKAPKPASFPHRLAMMEAFGRSLLSHQQHQKEEEQIIDIGVTTAPYFHDKAHAIASSGVYRESDMIFLAGYDTLIRIFNPKYYGSDGEIMQALDGFFSRARLRVTLRPDGEWGGEADQRGYLHDLASGVKLKRAGGRGIKEWTDRIELVEGVGGSVSSSRVREAVSAEEGVEGLDGLTGDDVKAWIEKEGLYRE